MPNDHLTLDEQMELAVQTEKATQEAFKEVDAALYHAGLLLCRIEALTSGKSEELLREAFEADWRKQEGVPF